MADHWGSVVVLVEVAGREGAGAVSWNPGAQFSVGLH